MQNQFSPRRMAGVGVVFAALVAFVAWVTTTYPVEIAKLSGSERTRYWPVALVAFLIVLTFDSFVIGMILRRRARESAGQAQRA